MSDTSVNELIIPKKWAGRFFTVWSGQAISLVGSSLVQFALVWYMTQKTGSATILATASMIALLPQIFLAPFAGAFVDRWNRKLTMIIADGIIALITLGLVFLFASGKIQIWHIYAAMLLRSAGGAFHFPAMSSSVPLMVPKEQLTRINGLNQLLRGVVNIAAPPLGALLLGMMSTQNVLFVDIGTAMAAIILLLAVSIPRPLCQVAQASGAVQKTSYWHDLRDGWRYLIRLPGLTGLAILAMLLNFVLGPAASFMPLVVTKHYHGGVTQLGWTELLFGIGFIVGGLALSAWGGFKKRIVTSLIGVLGMGVSILLFGGLPESWFIAALVVLLLAGVMVVFANGPLDAIFQVAVDPDYQGRVGALVGAGATAMMPVSLMIMGPLSDVLGIQFPYIFGGIACILITVAAFFIPVIMNIEENRKVGGDPSTPAEVVG